ncbi:hypothetical protein OIV83_002809 [Microbotryomycetes sp. JL201]|nr:hypothetical protein OIV83_002809 [Microbotryomycetes sp. JL201]
MPPLRLPKRTKNRVAQVDYSSVETALGSTAYDYDAWIEEGVAQQDQGDRYANSSGPKSTRHLQNAVIAFECASTLDPTAFDALYNAARVVQQLANEHLAPPVCVEATRRALAIYERCLALAKTEDERIDCMFNMAQAFVTAYEMDGDGLSDTAALSLSRRASLEKAVELFQETEQLQLASMNRVFGNDSQTALDDNDEEMDIENENVDRVASDAIGSATSTAIQARTVTPNLVLETVVETLQAQLSMIQDYGNQSPQYHELCSSIKQRLELGAKLDPSLGSDLALVRIDLAAAMEPVEDADRLRNVHEEYAKLLRSHPQHLGVLSSFADFLTDTIQKDQPSNARLATLEQAQKLYLQAEALLSSRLRPPPGVPPFSVPSLLASNLVSQSYLHVIRRHTSQDTDGEHGLATAIDLCVRAINSSKTSAIIVSFSPTQPSISFKPLTPAQVKDLKVYCDSFKSLRLAWFTLWRCWVMFNRNDLERIGSISWKQDMMRGWVLACAIPNRDPKLDLRTVLEEWVNDFAWTEQEAQLWNSIM